MGKGAQKPPWGCQGRAPGSKGQASDSTAHPTACPSAISSILGTWLDQYSEDFCQPPDFPCLKQLVAYVQLNMPGSDLERRAHLLLAQLEHAELTQAEPEGEEAGSGAGHGGAPEAAAGPGHPHRDCSREGILGWTFLEGTSVLARQARR